MGNIIRRQKINENKNNNLYESNEFSYNESKKILQNINNGDVNSVPYKNTMILGKITSVYDGDTCTCVFLYGNAPMKINIRIHGIDAPEIKSKNELEKKAGICVRELVKSYIENKVCYVKFLKHDKYGGRIVGDVFFGNGNISLSKYLLDNNYVKSYDGGKKHPWTNAELSNIINNISV